MPAERFLEIQSDCQKRTYRLKKRINNARDRVEIPPIEQLRPANASDIIEGNILYYHPNASDKYWKIVEEVRYPNDDFKAYVADDGCRYGLMHAFVRKED